MEGHRVVRLDVACYVIVGLGVSGFAWFGSVGLAWCGSSSYGVFRCVLAWQDWFVVFRFGKLRYGLAGMAGHGKSGYVTVCSGSAGKAR